MVIFVPAAAAIITLATLILVVGKRTNKAVENDEVVGEVQNTSDEEVMAQTLI